MFKLWYWIKQGPAARVGAALSLLLGGVTAAGVTGNLGARVDVSTAVQTLAPLVAAAAPAVGAAIIRAAAYPAAKVEAWAERDGLLTDADAARINAMIADGVRDAVKAAQNLGGVKMDWGTGDLYLTSQTADPAGSVLPPIPDAAPVAEPVAAPAPTPQPTAEPVATPPAPTPEVSATDPTVGMSAGAPTA